MNINSFKSNIESFFLLNKEGKFIALDGLRAYAAFIVFLFHIQTAASNMWGVHYKPYYLKVEAFVQKALSFTPWFGSSAGHTGVDLFFVISGFLIFYSLSQKKPSIIAFMSQRYKRLLPAHVSVILLAITVHTPLVIFLNIFFLQEYFTKVPTINFVTWTLTYEITFYFLLSVWITASNKYSSLKSWGFFLTVAICTWLLQWFLPEKLFDGRIRLLDISRFFAFFFGVALGKIYLETPLVWEKFQKYLPGLSIGALIFFAFWKNQWVSRTLINVDKTPHKIIFYLLVDIAFFVLTAGVLTTSNHFIKTLFSNLYLRVLGVISYSFYLCHALIGLAVGSRFMDTLKFYNVLKVGIYYVVTFIITFAISVFLYHFLEKPYFTKPKKAIQTPNTNLAL